MPQRGARKAMTGLGRKYWRDERGITGLETAIVLIAFVVVASVFAFTILSKGVLASDKTRETVVGGLSEAGGSLVLRGSMVALSNTSSPAEIDRVSFQVTNASRTGTGLELNTDGAIVTYTDSDQRATLIFTANPTSTAGWGVDWLVGQGEVLKLGERAEIIVNLTGLATRLMASQEFTIRVMPDAGAVLTVERTTPVELTGAIDPR